MRVRINGRAGLWITGMAALALLSTVSTASAQYYGYSRGPKTELTLFYGGYFGGDIYTGANSGLTRDVNVDDDWSYGARLAYIFNGMIGLEAGYGHSDAVLNVGSTGSLVPEPIGDLAEDRYELNINFYTNPGPVRGYFTLGGGATDFTATFDNNTEASETKFTSNIGLGIQFSKTPKLAFRVDGRWRYTDTNVGQDTYYCDFYGYCYGYDNSYYGSAELTGGIVLGLGGD